MLWSFQVWFDGLWNKEWQETKLGDAQGTPRWYSRSTKSLSLGMPRMASPVPSLFIGNFTWSYIFIHHMICVFLGASFSFVSICFMLFRIMFFISIFNKNVKDSLYHAYFASIHVAVWKQKVYRCCKNSLEKSEHGLTLNLFSYWAQINLLQW